MKKLVLLLIAIFFSFQVQAEELQKVRVGHVIGIQNSTMAMMIHRGWDHQNGFDIEPVKFLDAASIVQAMFRGDIDMAVIAPTVIMTANNQGGQFQVIGAAMVNSTDIFAVGDFAKSLDPSVSPEMSIQDLIEKKKENGEKASLVYVGPSTAPGIMAHRWMKEHGLDDSINYITANYHQLNQLAVTGAVDMAQLWEPAVTIMQQKQPYFRRLVESKDMITNQPFTGLGASKDFVETYPSIVQHFVNLHVKGTKMLRGNPLVAWQDYDETLNEGFINQETLKQILLKCKDQFEASPHVIFPPTQLSYDLLQEYGTFKVKSSVENLFNTSFYDQAMKGTIN